jgi:hypothetical protein
MQTLKFRELIFKFYFRLDKYLNLCILLLTSKYYIFNLGKFYFFLKNFIKTYDCNSRTSRSFFFMGSFCEWVTSTENLYVGWFGVT